MKVYAVFKGFVRYGQTCSYAVGKGDFLYAGVFCKRSRADFGQRCGKVQNRVLLYCGNADKFRFVSVGVKRVQNTVFLSKRGVAFCNVYRFELAAAVKDKHILIFCAESLEFCGQRHGLKLLTTPKRIVAYACQYALVRKNDFCKRVAVFKRTRAYFLHVFAYGHFGKEHAVCKGVVGNFQNGVGNDVFARFCFGIEYDSCFGFVVNYVVFRRVVLVVCVDDKGVKIVAEYVNQIKGGNVCADCERSHAKVVRHIRNSDVRKSVVVKV